MAVTSFAKLRIWIKVGVVHSADPCADLGCLMPASLELPHQCLMTAVKDMQALQDQAEEGAMLTRDMIKVRKRMAELATTRGVRSAYCTDGLYSLSACQRVAGTGRGSA